MASTRSRGFSIVAAGIGLAAVLGGSLGIATARVRQGETLSVGFNIVGGPIGNGVTAENFILCLPVAAWDAVYIWDGLLQQWKHHINTTGGIPAFINDTTLGGIGQIPNGAGVVLLMKQSVANPRLKDTNAEACG